MRNKWILSLTLVVIGTSTGIDIPAESSAAATDSASPTNVMPGYVEAVRTAIITGTEATNLTKVQISDVMNESIKTNLAAQLWFRQAMVGTASAQGAQISQTVRVLEALRAGQRDEAIRLLEDNLDSAIIVLAGQLRAADQTKTFNVTAGPGKSLRSAAEYRRKFPYKSGSVVTDEQVKEGLSYRDGKK